MKNILEILTVSAISLLALGTVASAESTEQIAIRYERAIQQEQAATLREVEATYDRGSATLLDMAADGVPAAAIQRKAQQIVASLERSASEGIDAIEGLRVRGTRELDRVGADPRLLERLDEAASSGVAKIERETATFVDRIEELALRLT